MIHDHSNDAPDARIGRRSMLARMGSVGLLATAGAGLSSLLGTSSAKASTVSTTFPPGVIIPTLGVASPADADCDMCVTCTYAPDHCSPDPCPAGHCCYFCSGDCVINYYQCYDKTCATKTFPTCNPN